MHVSESNNAWVSLIIRKVLIVNSHEVAISLLLVDLVQEPDLVLKIENPKVAQDLFLFSIVTAMHDHHASQDTRTMTHPLTWRTFDLRLFQPCLLLCIIDMHIIVAHSHFDGRKVASGTSKNYQFLIIRKHSVRISRTWSQKRLGWNDSPLILVEVKDSEISEKISGESAKDEQLAINYTPSRSFSGMRKRS